MFDTIRLARLGRAPRSLSPILLSLLPAVLLTGATTPTMVKGDSRHSLSLQTHSLSLQTVASAFGRAGLALDHLQRQPVGGDAAPGGPPPTERAAWGFVLHNQSHGDGRLLIFATLRGRDVKAVWFHHMGARILVRDNVIVWLDHALAPAIVSRCQHTLNGIG